MGENFFLFDKLFLPGQNNPEINFRFQITEIKQSSNLRKIKNRNDFTHFDFIFSDALFCLPSNLVNRTILFRNFSRSFRTHRSNSTIA
jgi:hypothetical protein